MSPTAVAAIFVWRGGRFQRATDDADVAHAQAMHGLGMLWLWAGKKSNSREDMIKSLESLEPLLDRVSGLPGSRKTQDGGRNAHQSPRRKLILDGFPVIVRVG